MIGPTLEADRLILRPPCADDFVAWAAFMADPIATEFLGGPKARQDAWRGLSVTIGGWSLSGFGNFSFIEKASGRWIGRAGAWYPEGWPGREIGWALDRSAWGKGYASEAARRCLDWVRDDLGWSEVIHVITPGNRRSIAVAERFGSRLLKMTTLTYPARGEVAIYGQSWKPEQVC